MSKGKETVLIGIRNVGNARNICGVILASGDVATIYTDEEYAAPVEGKPADLMPEIISEENGPQVTRKAAERILADWPYAFEPVYAGESAKPAPKAEPVKPIEVEAVSDEPEPVAEPAPAMTTKNTFKGK